MLQSSLYWEGFCQAIGRDDLAEDPRFADDALRSENVEACVEELDRTFLSQPLQVWKDRLATQEGQWDVVNKVSEVLDDVQVIANRFAQRIDYGNGHSLSLIASPIQFDRTPPTLSPAPGFAADTDAVLGALGWDMEAILEAKISGAVV